MNNNINNLGFNHVNFSGLNEKPDVQQDAECSCPECKQADAEAAAALEAMGRAQIGKHYKQNPEDLKHDLEEFANMYDECLREVFARDCYDGFVNEGVDPDRAYELAQVAARCLNPNR